MVVIVLKRRSWQVAYVWAFMIKFKQVEKVPRLETIEEWVPHRYVASLSPQRQPRHCRAHARSFERCLVEPLANRPDDILEGILVRFLSNLKPGLRNLE
jgi:hypothetical protein